MSRIGKKQILIPPGVQVEVEGGKIRVQGPKGEISRDFGSRINIVVDNNKISVLPKDSVQDKAVRSLWGTVAAVIINMVKGVVQPYEKKLEIEGVGFKAAVEGDQLSLNVGFTHPVKIKAPEGIKFLVEKNVIVVSGIDKELVGQKAAEIRRAKPVEPYKGKGIKYAGEYVRRKLGKKAVATAT